MIRKIVNENHLNINRYSLTNNSIKTNNGAMDNKYIYIKRIMYVRCSQKLLVAKLILCKNE